MRTLKVKAVHIPENMTIIEMAMADFKKLFKRGNGDLFELITGHIYWLSADGNMCIVGVP